MARKPKIERNRYARGLKDKSLKPDKRCKIKVVYSEPMRLYPTRVSQCVLDSAEKLRDGKTRLLNVCLEETSYSTGGGRAVRPVFFYQVDAKAVLPGPRVVPIRGLAVLKTVGTHPDKPGCPNLGGKTRVPPADIKVCKYPLADIRLEERSRGGTPLTGVPPAVLNAFENDLYFGDEGKKAILFLLKHILTQQR